MITTKENVKKYFVKNNCVYCLDSGFILSDDESPKAYRCHCTTGDRVPSFVARWHGNMVRIVPAASEIVRKK